MVILKNRETSPPNLDETQESYSHENTIHVNHGYETGVQQEGVQVIPIPYAPIHDSRGLLKVWVRLTEAP